MTSPFADNATFPKSRLLIPQTDSNAALVQDEIGNWRLPELPDLEYTAYFCTCRPTNNKYLPTDNGLDSESLKLEGYLVEPMILPDGFIPPDRIKCYIPSANGEIAGEIRLEIVPESVAGLAAVVGQKIKGRFFASR